MEGVTDNLSVTLHANRETADIHWIIHRDDASGGTNFRANVAIGCASCPVLLIEISIYTNKT